MHICLDHRHIENLFSSGDPVIVATAIEFSHLLNLSEKKKMCERDNWFSVQPKWVINYRIWQKEYEPIVYKKGIALFKWDIIWL